jgi:hypothetical protein
MHEARSTKLKVESISQVALSLSKGSYSYTVTAIPPTNASNAQPLCSTA